MISLTGYALTLIYFSPNPLVFAQQQVGTQSSQQEFSIENLSSRQSFTISSITLQGSDFILAGNNCPAKLLPDYGCGAQIVFAPTGTGTRTGTVTVVASDSAQPHIEQLQGIGVGAGQVSLSSSSLTFAPQTVGTTSTAKVVKVTNTGSATLNLGTITASPSFFIATTGCGATLAVGGTCNISVKFSPTLAGILVGTLTINDDASGNPHLVALTGIGQ